MQCSKWHAVLLLIVAIMFVGCGGNDGTISLPTTKTATVKFTSNSINASELLSGFYLIVTLPVGSTLQVGSSGAPASSAVYLSGKFAGASPQINAYNSASRTLEVNYASSINYSLGEFMTVVINVPYSYVPNTNDIVQSFTAWNPSGVQSVTATSTFTFN